jgi:hypothetical protein
MVEVRSNLKVPSPPAISEGIARISQIREKTTLELGFVLERPFDCLEDGKRQTSEATEQVRPPPEEGQAHDPHATDALNS